MKYKILITFLFVPFLVFSQTANYNEVIENMANQLAKAMSKKGKNTITVTDFLNTQKNLTELGVDVANDLEAALLMTDYDFTLVSRDELNRILKEQEISRSRITEKENVKRIGQISNVDVMIVGEVSSWGEQISIKGKLLDVETANLIGAARGELNATGVVKEKVEKIITFSNGSSNNQTAPNIPELTEEIQSTSNGHYQIDLLGCKQTGQKISCDLKITSKGRDGGFTLKKNRASRFFDLNSAEYFIDEITLGGITKSAAVSKDMIGDLPILGKIDFTGISKKIDYIPKLELSVWGNEASMAIITFRSISVK